jgi:hypothetical protein
LATKFSHTTRRPSLFDRCFRRKNPPVNGRAAIFFHLFRRGFCLERPFTEGFRAFAACGLWDFFRFGRDRPRPDRTPGTHLSRTLQDSRYCNKMHGLWRRSLREFVVIVVLPPTRGRGVSLARLRLEYFEVVL